MFFRAICTEGPVVLVVICEVTLHHYFCVFHLKNKDLSLDSDFEEVLIDTGYIIKKQEIYVEKEATLPHFKEKKECGLGVSAFGCVWVYVWEIKQYKFCVYIHIE